MSYPSSSAGVEAAKQAAHLEAKMASLYSDPFNAPYPELLDSTSTYYDEDMTEAVAECLQYAEATGLEVKYLPDFWNDLRRIRIIQKQLRAKYAKGDVSAYSYLRGKTIVRGEPVWKLSDKWFIYDMDPGGSGLIEGGRGFGKTLLGTQDISLPYIDSYRHVVSGIHVDKIVPDRNPEAKKYYHYNSSLNGQLQTAIEIKIASMEKQLNEHKGPEKLIFKHPLVIDMIDEASMSRGKYRTQSDKAMQQMYVAAIARHLGIWVCEIHPFDDTLIWVRDTLTHKFTFTERGKLNAIIKKSGQKIPEEKKIWGFKSLEDRIRDGDPRIEYRPYAPVSFTVDVNIIAMLDQLNRQMKASMDAGEKVDEIAEWTIPLKWLKDNIIVSADEIFGLTYNNVVSSLALFMAANEEYDKIMKGTDKYRPLRITRDLVEGVMERTPFQVKAGTLGGDVMKARRFLKTFEYGEKKREEIEDEILSKLRAQGAAIDSEGNFIVK